jgi:hypothetical protein
MGIPRFCLVSFFEGVGVSGKFLCIFVLAESVTLAYQCIFLVEIHEHFDSVHTECFDQFAGANCQTTPGSAVLFTTIDKLFEAS